MRNQILKSRGTPHALIAAWPVLKSYRLLTEHDERHPILREFFRMFSLNSTKWPIICSDGNMSQILIASDRPNRVTRWLLPGLEKYVAILSAYVHN